MAEHINTQMTDENSEIANDNIRSWEASLCVVGIHIEANSYPPDW